MKLSIVFTIFLFTNTIIGQNFHTKFEYKNSINKDITVQNSYPKGGQRFTTTNGKEFVYVTFWTSISNNSASNLELEIDFSANSFIIPSAPNINFNLYIPNNEMTLEKESLPNYGLDIINFLKENMNKPSKLRTIIKPNSSHLFYAVVISNKGVNGTVRAGFELQKEELIYTINNHEINCGKILIN
ncbi:hypothetical protein BTO15_09830 [Polaribacter sejongensis]|uniref:Uncharacterized protein n=1 Tax=Polaribacter sejongensis TaxID=985043 RepID=A0ABN5F5T2_9FLAO|nr:hypothetical protein [Polaribacter sejongensis]AUC22373.1 hypothetical protein BTO15_09830 [Polaribacter sejongensis]